MQNFSLDLDLINIAAKWLREYLNLTVFGFDVVVSVSYLFYLGLLFQKFPYLLWIAIFQKILVGHI